MSTIHFNQTTTLTPDQYVAGLTDFGPGRSDIFSKSADEYLEVHSVGPAEADVTEGSGASGSDCTTTGRIATESCSGPPTPTWGGSSGYTYTFKRLPDGRTDVDVVIVRDGKNAKGRFLGR